MSIDLERFHDIFFEESHEGVEAMESALLDLNIDQPQSETIHGIFRAAHSIKGGAGTFGFNQIVDFTHIVETLLDGLRTDPSAITRETVPVLLESVDVIREMLNAAQSSQEADSTEAEAVRAKLMALIETSLGGDSSRPLSGRDTQSTETASSQRWRIKFRPHRHLLETGNDPALLFRELSEMGALDVHADIANLPDFDQFMPTQCHLAWTLQLDGDVTEAAIREIFEWVDGDCELEITAMGEPPSNLETVLTENAAAASNPVPDKIPAAGPNKSEASSSIRVSIDKIDSIINLVGELVITQSMLGELGGKLEQTDGTEINQALQQLQTGLLELERNTRELQEGVMRIRMLPISFIFNRFPRLAHDLCQKLYKKVDLQISGEHTELDKTVLEKIGDPLVHLVRNALDHGIETPNARIAAGKPETGILRLYAHHQGGNVVIEITDDGAGLDRQKILAKAREQNLVGPNEVVPEDKIPDLLFEPGFSTATTVSNVSGRGVGMDVVRRNIQSLGGSVELASELGKGTKLTIRLPLTLAIVDGQLIRVGDRTFVVPLVAIVESLQISPDNVNTVANGVEVYKLRNEYIPVIRLYQLLDIPGAKTRIQDALMVVVEGDGRRIGLLVDDLLAQQQVVIKSVETNYQPVEGLAGATILGDGTVALILDATGIIQLARADRRAVAAA